MPTKHSRYRLSDLRQVLRVGVLEVLDLTLLEVPDARGYFVDHVVIVSHQQHRAFITLQRDVESVDRFQIQVVSGFVQHQEIRLLQHQTAEDQSGRLAPG